MRATVALVTNIPVDNFGNSSNNSFIWVTVAGVRIYSCYWSPNSTLADYENFLGRLESSVRASSVALIVARDFNAKHWL